MGGAGVVQKLLACARGGWVGGSFGGWVVERIGEQVSGLRLNNSLGPKCSFAFQQYVVIQ